MYLAHVAAIACFMALYGLHSVDCWLSGYDIDSQPLPVCCQITALGKLVTQTYTCASVIEQHNLVLANGQGAG